MTIKKAVLPASGVKEPSIVNDFHEFAKNDWECAEIDLKDKTAYTVYCSYRTILKRHADIFEGIHVAKRGNRVFLVKEVNNDD